MKNHDQHAETNREFERALASGRLSTVATSPLFYDHYLFMGGTGPDARFKHRDSRMYLSPDGRWFADAFRNRLITVAEHEATLIVIVAERVRANPHDQELSFLEPRLRHLAPGRSRDRS